MKRPRPFAMINIDREIALPSKLAKAFPELRRVAKNCAEYRALLVLTEDDKFTVNMN